jgi:5,10-methylene-tetrahydrofolate dehydrogenase/methenyl tetrahydrofolate cyclohydrolase
MKIIDGKKIREEILTNVKNEVASLSFQPIFCDILVGDNPVSAQYVDMKMHKAESVGMAFHRASFLDTITNEELINEIEKINKIPNMCGIIVQLPLPKSLDTKRILNAIDPKLDVDCLGDIRSREFYAGDTSLGFPTALSCMALLDSIGLEFNLPGSKKNIVVLGYGELVGRPVSALLDFRGLAPKIVRSKTENKEDLIKNADIIISGIGNGKYITGDKIKEGVILIDAGTSESNAGIVGDVDLDSVRDKASFVSPVPGGVGPVTVAMLLKNVLNVAKSISK